MLQRILPYLKHFLIILLGAVGLCYFAWYNRFPLTYSDTGTYILFGFEGKVPVDRPIYYCLFIRHISMATSLWFVILAQGVLLSYVMYRFLGNFFRGIRLWAAFLSLIVFLDLTTGLSWNVSILIPDIFTAIGFMCMVNMLLHPTLRKAEWVFHCILLMFSISTHLSNIPILGGVGLCVGLVWLYHRIRKRKFSISFLRLAITGGSIAVIFAAIPLLNAALGGEARFSEGSHVFRINHLLDTGVLKPYLNRTCAEKKYRICEYKDELNWTFMWGPESPLYRTGGWKANEDDYNRVLHDINRDPQSRMLIFRHNMEFAMKQFFQFEVDPPMPFDDASPPWFAINKHFKDSVPEASSCKQRHKVLDIKNFNDKTRWVTLVSLFLLALIRMHRRFFDRLPIALQWMVTLTLLLLVINAFVCGNLSTPLPRYQNRIAWLAVFDVLLVAMVAIGMTPLWQQLKAKLSLPADSVSAE